MSRDLDHHLLAYSSPIPAASDQLYRSSTEFLPPVQFHLRCCSPPPSVADRALPVVHCFPPNRPIRLVWQSDTESITPCHQLFMSVVAQPSSWLLCLLLLWTMLPPLVMCWSLAQIQLLSPSSLGYIMALPPVVVSPQIIYTSSYASKSLHCSNQYLLHLHTIRRSESSLSNHPILHQQSPHPHYSRSHPHSSLSISHPESFSTNSP